MQEIFKIWIDRLSDGQVQKIEGSFEPSFLEINENDLKFRAPVKVVGKAYLADEHLVINLKTQTIATVPCAICNEMMEKEVKVENFYHSEALEEIPGAVFDFSGPLREALLIELPHYFECNGGNCPERVALAPFLRSALKKEGPKTDTNKNNFPFADL